MVVRLLEDGSLNASFNATGELPGALAFTPRSLSPDMLGTHQAVTQILVGGGGAWLGGLAGSFFLERVLDDGTIDPTFQVGAFGPRLAWADDMLLLPGDSVAAYGADGTPRQDFGTAGIVRLDHPEDGNSAFSTAFVLAQGLDKLLLVEYHAGQSHVARITRAGKLDTSFGTAGFSAPFDCAWKDAAVVCDGKIALIGYRPRPSAADQYCAVVLTPDGQPVQGSPADGVFIWDEASAAASVSSAIAATIDATTGSVVYIHGNTGSLYMARINLPR